MWLCGDIPVGALLTYVSQSARLENPTAKYKSKSNESHNNLRCVDQVEQSWKGIAQIEAAAATVTDFEYPLEFRIERRRIIELRVLPA